MMTARLQCNINHRTFCWFCKRSNSITFCVKFSILFMIAFPDDPSVFYDHCPYHRIGIRPAFSFFGQLNRPKHIFLIRHFYSFFLIPVLCLGYAEAFKHVQSDSQTSEWYSYFENDVPDTKKACRNICRVELICYI